MTINKGANKEDHKTACNQHLISNSSTVHGNNEDISKQTYRVNFVKGVMKTTIVKLVTIFPLSKMNNQLHQQLSKAEQPVLQRVQSKMEEPFKFAMGEQYEDELSAVATTTTTMPKIRNRA